MDPQDFGFLDPDPQERIRIKRAKYQQNTEKNYSQITTIEKRDIIKTSLFLNGSSSFSPKISEKKDKKFENSTLLKKIQSIFWK